MNRLHSGIQILFTILSYFLYCPPLLSQSADLHFESIPIESGISDLKVRAIAQDQQGFMWFGTSDGLNRYDGYEYQVYRHNPIDSTSLPGNYVEELYVDSRGNIWVAILYADAGLCRYDPQTDGFIRFAHNPEDSTSIAMTYVQSIGESRDGYLWVGSDGRLDRMDPATGSFRHFRHVPEDTTTITAGAVFMIYEDRRGDLWIGTGDPWIKPVYGGLNKYDPKKETFIRYPYDPDHPTGLRNQAVMSAFEDDRGNFWVGTGGGLHLMDRDKGTFDYFSYDPARPNDLSYFPDDDIVSVNCIKQDQLGRLWFAGVGGIVLYDPEENRVIRYGLQAEQADMDLFWEMNEDRFGNIWLGAGDSPGLYKVNLNSQIFKEYQVGVGGLEKSKGRYFMAFEKEDGNRFWLGTRQGLYLFNPTEDIVERSLPLLEQVYDIEKQGSDILWYGTIRGLYKYDLRKGESTLFKTVDSLRIVSKLYLSSTGILWVGACPDGVFRLDPGSHEFVRCQGDDTGWVLSMLEDRSGRLWAGGTNGLFHYNLIGDQWERILEIQVNTLFEDGKDRFWIGTEGEGLWHYDRESGALEKFSLWKELSAGSIYAITEDSNGALWMTTSRKIVKFLPGEKVFQNFDAENGILNQFHYNSSTAVVVDQNGNIYFGGANGITSILAQDRQQINIPPQITLTHLQTSKQSIPLLYRVPANLEFSHDDNSLVFEYVGLHYANPSQNQYRYILENFDEEWIAAGDDRKARYANLDPGQYTFRVQAASSAGLWSEEASLEVVIHPPWWATVWAYIFYFLLVLGTLYLLRRFEFRRQERRLAQEKQKLEQERKVSEKLRRLDALKDQFLANTSHELRTPLQGIIGLSESLLERVPETDQKEDLSMIVSSGKRLANLINDILDFSKLKNYDIQLLRRPVNLRVLTDIVLRNNAPLVKGKDLDLVNSISANLVANADENRLQQVLYNLIGNAIKFTEQGHIKIYAREKGGLIQVSVEDTGIGVPAHKQEAIFQEFEQGDGSISREFTGTGLGLSISKRLIELHGGEMWVESKEGKGSTFFFTLPVSTAKSTTLTPVKEVPESVENGRSEQTKTASPALSVNPNELIRILVVDDEPVNQQVFKNHLSGKGFHITQALNGREALQTIQSNPPFDLVILDVMMPRMSGYEVCQKIRKKYLPSELPVIMVTAKDQLQDIVQGLSYGANDYLPKPFHKEELLARINTQLDLHRIFDVAGKFVPNEFLHSLKRNRITEVTLDDYTEQEVTVLFSDIRDYTSLSESMSPEENYKFVKAFNRRMGPIIRENNGFVNQYLGDAIMAIFSRNSADALKAAVDMQKKLAEYNRERITKTRKEIKIGVGLHSGPLIMGIIGDQKRMDATTIADTVNTASRIESLTRYYGVSILLSEECLNEVENQDKEVFHFRYLGRVLVKGKKKPVGIYECFDGDPPTLMDAKLKTTAAFSEGLQHYFAGNFPEAIPAFNSVLLTNPEDKPARLFLNLSSKYILEGVSDDWTGIEVMTFK